MANRFGLYGFEGSEKVFKLSENPDGASWIVVTKRAVVRIDVPANGYVADVYNINIADEKLVNLSKSDKEFSFLPLIESNANMLTFATKIGENKWRIMAYFHNSHDRVMLLADTDPTKLVPGASSLWVNDKLVMYGIAKPVGLTTVSAMVVSKPKSGGERGGIEMYGIDGDLSLPEKSMLLDSFERYARQNSDAGTMLAIAFARMDLIDQPEQKVDRVVIPSGSGVISHTTLFTQSNEIYILDAEHTDARVGSKHTNGIIYLEFIGGEKDVVKEELHIEVFKPAPFQNAYKRAFYIDLRSPSLDRLYKENLLNSHRIGPIFINHLLNFVGYRG